MLRSTGVQQQKSMLSDSAKLQLSKSVPSLPQQSQPILAIRHRHTAERALLQRRQQRQSAFGLIQSFDTTPFPTNNNNSSPLLIPTLIFLIPPLHIWHSDHGRRDLEYRCRTCLRGQTQSWNVFVYTSRSKALEHVRNMHGKPIRDRNILPPHLLGDCTAASSLTSLPHEIILAQAMVAVESPLNLYHQVAQPLNLPVIYFGSRGEDLNEVSAHPAAIPYAVDRLDAVFSIGAELFRKNEIHGSGIAGLGRAGSTTKNWPYPALLSGAGELSSKRFHPLTENEIVRVEDLQRNKSSRPNSPAYVQNMQKQLQEGLQQLEEQKQSEQEEMDNNKENVTQHPQQQSLQSGFHPTSILKLQDASKRRRPEASAITFKDNLPPTSTTAAYARATALSASTSTNAETTTAPIASPLSLRKSISSSPDFRGIQVSIPDSHTIPSAAEDMGVIELPPTTEETLSHAAQERRVTFSASTKLSDTSRLDPAQHVPDKSLLSPLLSPSRTVRNPFGTDDGKPSVEQQEALLRNPLGEGPLRTTRLKPPTTPSVADDEESKLELFNQSVEDAERLEAIATLRKKLHAYKFKAAPPQVYELPDDNQAARMSDYEKQLDASHIISDEVKAMLLAEQRSIIRRETRPLNALEQKLEHTIAEKEKVQKEWMATQSANLWALQQRRDKTILLENEGEVNRFVGAKQYAKAQITEHHRQIREEKKQAILAQIEAYNESQSTARAVALLKVPDAPRLSNLQAVFLSPRSRREAPHSAVLDAALQDNVHKLKSPEQRKRSKYGKFLTVNVEAPDVASTRERQSQQPVAAVRSPSNSNFSSPFSMKRALLSPRVVALGANRHVPSPGEIEAALRKDYAQMDEERREEERKRLELEAVVWRKNREAKLQAILAQQQQDILLQQAEEEYRAETDERVRLKKMITQVLGGEDSDSSADESDEEEERARSARLREKQRQIRRKQQSTAVLASPRSGVRASGWTDSNSTHSTPTLMPSPSLMSVADEMNDNMDVDLVEMSPVVKPLSDAFETMAKDEARLLARIHRTAQAPTMIELFLPPPADSGSGTNSELSSPRDFTSPLRSPRSPRESPRRKQKREARKEAKKQAKNALAVQKKVALFDALTPQLATRGLDIKRHAAEQERKARTERIVEELKRKEEEEKEQQEREKQIERRALWLKQNPPIRHEILSKTKRVERRNPHEWQLERQIVQGVVPIQPRPDDEDDS